MKCLVPECKRDATTRGLCGSHKGTAMKLVRNKLATEEQLVAAGKLLPKPTVRSKAQAWFLDGIKKAAPFAAPSSRAADRLPQDPSPDEIRERAAAARAARKS